MTVNGQKTAFSLADNEDPHWHRPHAATTTAAFSLGAFIPDPTGARSRPETVRHAGNGNNGFIGSDDWFSKNALHLRSPRQIFM